MRFLITFSYDGSKYSGYQKQPNERTIQNELETCLTRINKKSVSVSASGRTDAGVHALNQKAHFDLDINISKESLQRAMNSLLPEDIYIRKVDIVEKDFHARFNAKKKEYIYLINMGEYNPIERNYIYQYSKKLNINEMKKAIKYFVGEHNFKSFTCAKDERDSYIRTIYSANINVEKNKIIISFVGTGFMRYMVRNMVGILLEIGSGKRKCSEINYILLKKDRKSSGTTAPSYGLYLKNVYY